MCSSAKDIRERFKRLPQIFILTIPDRRQSERERGALKLAEKENFKWESWVIGYGLDKELIEEIFVAPSLALLNLPWRSR